jgi:hypothetical protein
MKGKPDPGYWILDTGCWIKAKIMQRPRLEIRDSRFVKAKFNCHSHFAFFTFHFSFCISFSCFLLPLFEIRNNGVRDPTQLPSFPPKKTDATALVYNTMASATSAQHAPASINETNSFCYLMLTAG